MSAIFGWILKNPLTAVLGAVVAGLLILLATCKLAQAHIEHRLAQVRMDAAEQAGAYDRAAQKRAEAVSDAFQQAWDALEAQTRKADDLLARVATERQSRQNEQQQADRRLAALEAENAKLREWNDTWVPDDMVDWMLEPAQVPGT